jgi:hypothetical protein
MSYAADTTVGFRELAGYVDKILKGAAPNELPVQAPTKFELVINLKTAAAGPRSMRSAMSPREKATASSGCLLGLVARSSGRPRLHEPTPDNPCELRAPPSGIQSTPPGRGCWRPIEPALAMLSLCSFESRQVPEMADPALLGLRSVPGHPDADLVRALRPEALERPIATTTGPHDGTAVVVESRGRPGGRSTRSSPSLLRSVDSLLAT